MKWANNPLARHFAWLVTVIFLALVQTNWPAALKFQGVVPDIILIMVVFYAIAEGEERAMFTGLVGGLYQDVATASVMGHHVLSLVVVGFIAGRISTRLVTEHPFVKAGLVLFSGFSNGLLFYAIQYVQQPQRGFIFQFAVIAMPCAFYTALIAPALFLLLDLTVGRRRTAAGRSVKPA